MLSRFSVPLCACMHHELQCISIFLHCALACYICAVTVRYVLFACCSLWFSSYALKLQVDDLKIWY